jgi:hypothetical protein
MFVYDARRSVKKKRSRAPPLAQFVNVTHDINLEKNEAVYVNIRLTFSRRNFRFHLIKIRRVIVCLSDDLEKYRTAITYVLMIVLLFINEITITVTNKKKKSRSILI